MEFELLNEKVPCNDEFSFIARVGYIHMLKNNLKSSSNRKQSKKVSFVWSNYDLSMKLILLFFL